MNTQANRILELLEKGDWICTSDMYRLYMADPRRRICDLKDKGYKLESRRCQQHTFHKGGSKEWRLTPKMTLGTAKNSQVGGMTSKEFMSKFGPKVEIKEKVGLW